MVKTGSNKKSLSRYSPNRLIGAGANPIPGLSPAAYYQFNTGITTTGSGVSQWDDQTGNGNHLKQATDAARPPKQGDGSILFNGTSQFLKCTAFTLNQPTTVFLRFKIVSWVLARTIFDGNTANTGRLMEANSTPNISLNAGATVAENTNLVVGTYSSVMSVFNGASSQLTVDATAKTTGNAGAGNMGGFTLGANGSNAQFGNIQVVECAVFPTALTDAQIAAINAYRGTGWP